MAKNINTSSFWNYKNFENVEMLLGSPIYKHKHRTVLNWIGKKSGSLLNIGVGNGYLEKILLLKNKSIDISSIDISKSAIENIKSTTKGIFKIANITKIPFKNNTFDFITALDLLEHLTPSQLEKGVSEIRRVLKPEGILIISVPLNENKNDQKLNRHILSFSKKSLLRLLIENNFKIVKVKELFAFPRAYLLKSIIANLVKIKKPNLLIVLSIKLDI